jgi:hypothetical protein
MSRILTTQEIQRLLNEPKKLPSNWETRLKPLYRSETCHGRRAYDFTGDNGSKFRIDVRDSTLNLLDFSIILTYIDGSEQEYILTRFNGKHPSGHTNKWEKKHGVQLNYFRNEFHIHEITERYQTEGFAADGYAEVTQRYVSFGLALRAFARSNGFYIEGANKDTPLFDEEE